MPHNHLRTVTRHPLAQLELYVAGIFLAATAPWFGWWMVPLGVFIILIGEIGRRAHSLILYDDGIMMQYRLLAHNQSFVEYHDIQGVELTQSLIERMLSLGTIHVDTAGGAHKEIVYPGVKDPHTIETMIRDGMRGSGSSLGNAPGAQASQQAATPSTGDAQAKS